MGRPGKCPILKGYPDWFGEPGVPDRICDGDHSMNGLHHNYERIHHMGETEETDYYWDDAGNQQWPDLPTR